MPCVSCNSAPDHCYENENRLRKEKERLKSLLCSVCRVLEKKNYDFDENPRLSEWWDAHKKADAAKKKSEDAAQYRAQQARKLLEKPIGKLTADEKKLLRTEGYL